MHCVITFCLSVETFPLRKASFLQEKSLLNSHSSNYRILSNKRTRCIWRIPKDRPALVCKDDLDGGNSNDVHNSDTSNSSANPDSTASQTATSSPPIAPEIDDADETSDFTTPAKSSQVSSEAVNSPEQSRQYSLRTRLREEIEAPFRKARMFVYAGSAASAGVGAFISTLRIIAAIVGTSGVQPLSETIPNVAVDLGVIGLCALLLRQETKAGEKRLERMSRGARISKLRLEDVTTRQIVTLKDVRGSKRIVVVAGRADGVKEAVKGAFPLRDELEEASLRVIPLVSESYNDLKEEDVLQGWRFTPYGSDDWKRWYSEERDISNKRLKNDDDVIVIVIRLDGKVGARSIGKPNWDRLIDEVKRLPPKDQYGKP